MTSSLTNRVGIFFPEEVEAMRLEFDAETAQSETPEQREQRASAIIARHQIRKTDSEPPQL
jgi:hypothetical protein